jgi:Fic family protein
VERSPEDLREVGNYVVALERGIARLQKLPLSLRLVRELHERLMRGVRGHRATPGEFRTGQNWIGPPGSTLANATYVPPPVEEMPALTAWEAFLRPASDRGARTRSRSRADVCRPAERAMSGRTLARRPGSGDEGP